MFPCSDAEGIDRSTRLRSTMLRLRKPTDEEIRRLIDTQAQRPFSYEAVRATRTKPPAGYVVDHNRAVLGRGSETFRRAVEAVRRWQMFSIPGVQLCWPTAPIEVGTTVVILARAGVAWSLNACRIVYTIDEDDRF